MPGKSRRRRGKRSARSKERRVRQAVSVTPSQRQATAQGYEPVSQVPTPLAKAPALRPILTPVHYPYIAAELLRIAILAGIMLAVLLILYFVIP